MAKDVLSVDPLPAPTTPAVESTTSAPISLESPIVLEQRRQAGVGWFTTIVLFSVINSVITLSGNTLAFIVGLGVTQLIDGIALYIMQDASTVNPFPIQAIAFLLDLAMIGVFAFFALLARRRNRWAYAGGMALYAVDALLLLLLQSWLSFAFHLYALWNLWRGFQATQTLRKLEQAGQLSVTPEQLQAMTGPNGRRRNPVNWKFIGGAALVGLIVVIVVSFVGRIFLEAYAASMP